MILIQHTITSITYFHKINLEAEEFRFKFWLKFCDVLIVLHQWIIWKAVNWLNGH